MNLRPHLTDDQIDDYLIGDAAEACVAHIAVCATCKARVTLMEAPIASFKDTSLAWSERKSATMPARPAGTQTHAAAQGSMWVGAVTAVLAFGIVIPLAHHKVSFRAPVAQTTEARTFVAEREEQITQDNQLLRDIDRELGAQVRTPSETFGLDLGPAARRSTQTAPIRDE